MNHDLNNPRSDGIDSFEERLRSTPLAAAPADLRASVLRQSKPAPVRDVSITGFLRQILWPHPLAWGGIAALWMITLGFRLATPAFDETRNGIVAAAPQDEETHRLVAAQRAELLAWLGKDDRDLPPDADRPKPKASPAPRSSLNFTNYTA